MNNSNKIIKKAKTYKNQEKLMTYINEHKEMSINEILELLENILLTDDSQSNIDLYNDVMLYDTLEKYKSLDNIYKKQDHINNTLDTKLDDNLFRKKIDLSGKCDEQDISLSILTNGKKYYENSSYKPLPDELKNIKTIGRGNQDIPLHLQGKII